jgi:metal-sulfur cluster biosynthetic enzyme
MINKKSVLSKLKKVLDPELGISIVDLGLIYGVRISKTNIVTVDMTLTTIGCPLFEVMAKPIKEKIKSIKGVKNVKINLIFDPPWSMEKMSKDAKIMLGFN